MKTKYVYGADMEVERKNGSRESQAHRQHARIVARQNGINRKARTSREESELKLHQKSKGLQMDDLKYLIDNFENKYFYEDNTTEECNKLVEEFIETARYEMRRSEDD